jgi:hypothetical protein
MKGARTMHYEKPYWQTHNLLKPIYKGGFPRIKMSFYNSSDGWHDIGYNEFISRVERLGEDSAAASTRLNEGYMVDVGHGVCLLAELVEQTEEKRAGKGQKTPASMPGGKKYEPEDIYKQISLF